MIAISVTGIFLTMLTAGVLTENQTVLSEGIVSAVGVGVYTNYECTKNCTNIDWGAIDPGNSTTKTIYIKNTGNIPVILSLTSTNWEPSNASTCLTLTWNRENYLLAAGNSMSARLTLAASSNADNITEFSFDVVVTGTQQ